MTNKQIWARAVELLGTEELNRRFRAWANSLIRRETAKRANMSVDELFIQQAQEILDDLNKRTGRSYGLTDDAKTKIRAILTSGYAVDDFRKVHEVMVRKWSDDIKMRDYLRPSTLWQLSKFDERLALWAPAVSPPPKHAQKKETHVDQRKVDELLARPWNSFKSWADFVKHVAQLPDAEALARYPMPDKIDRMRRMPGMFMRVLRNDPTLAAVDEVYQQIKKEVKK